MVILPYWDARHPDQFARGNSAMTGAFLAGLKKLDPETEPHRPFKVIYSSLYANVIPSFVVDISAQFERRMDALFAYSRNTERSRMAPACFRSRRRYGTGWRDRAILRKSDRRQVR